jgi:hypothetical protein
MKKEKVSISDFIYDAFDYHDKLEEVAINNAVNIYLLEFIANGYVKYGDAKGFVNNIDKWLRSITEIFNEISFNRETNQLHAVIDLKDQHVVIDDTLKESLEYVINTQSKYGLLIRYKSDRLMLNNQSTLLRFFEEIEKYYPRIKDRYKGLGSSPSNVSRETMMDPNTRRVVRVDITDPDTKKMLDALVGKGPDNIQSRKEILTAFKYDWSMIDN